MPAIRASAVIVSAILVVVSAIALSGATLARTTDASTATQAASGPGSWKLTFASPVTPDVAAAVVQSAHIQLAMLAFEQQANSMTWAGEVNVADAKGPSEIAQTFTSLRLSTIANQLVQISDVMAERGAEPQLVRVKTSLEETAAELRGGAHVTGATLLADESAVRGLATDSRVREVRSLRPITAPPAGRVTRDGPSKLGLASPLRTVRNDWVPDDVYLTIAPNGSDRYAQQLIGWASGRALNWCYRCGYEAIMFEYNYDNIHYLNADFWPGSEIPIVVTWSSNLPGPYLHTRWNDKSPCQGCYKSEVGFSIGTNGWNWGQIYPGNMYNTYIQVHPGNASTGKAKQAPTLTSCVGSNCDTWEMYHQDQCSYDYGNTSTFWPVRNLPVSYWHWNRYNGSDNGLQPGCF